MGFFITFCNIVFLINTHHVILLCLNILIVQLPGSHQHFLQPSNRKSELSEELILLQIIAPNITLYKKLKNQLKCHIREAKLSYLKQLLLPTKNNPHSAVALWSAVNNIIGQYRVRKYNTINITLFLDSINDFSNCCSFY